MRAARVCAPSPNALILAKAAIFGFPLIFSFLGVVATMLLFWVVTLRLAAPVNARWLSSAKLRPVPDPIPVTFPRRRWHLFVRQFGR